MHASTLRIEPIATHTVLKCIFHGAAGLTALSLGLAVAGHYFGRDIALGGHSEDATLQEIVIGNDVLDLPANMIRFRKQRQSGVAGRVDIYLRWPDMQGYEPKFWADFNSAEAEKRILFAAFEPRVDAYDMSGRYGPVYSRLTSGPGAKGPAGLTIQPFLTESEFVNEELVVGPEQAGKAPFVARCLDAATSRNNRASCQRDVFVGKTLQLTYRFPREMLKDWREIDAQMQDFASTHIKSAE